MNTDPRCRICNCLGGLPLCEPRGQHSDNRRQTKVHRQYLARQTIFHEGDPPVYVFYIHSGAVKLSKSGAGERPVVIRILGAGDVLGYRAVLGEEELAATAEALQDCTMCAIPRETFIEAIRGSSELAAFFLKLLCQELRTSEELWLRETRESAQKLALRLLHRLADDTGMVVTGRGQDRLLQRSEIAELIGISAETFSRVLKKLAEGGVITLEPHVIRIVNFKRSMVQSMFRPEDA